ncbi:MAG: GspB domain-containing protein, partial [Gammaproteobacteria bacterium]|nr:GspB domain-containing protein [Gammaproteobacteria bacterium]
ESARRQPPPISYWELPKDVRESLPPFKISVLVYAENAEDRFILMNGARQVQADTVVPELQLVEIQRDRVIFSHRNYRFYVKQ